MFHVIYQRFNGITWNIQQILNRLYEVEDHVVNESQVNEAILHIVRKNSMQYESLMLFLTDNQLSVLKAIAKIGVAKSPLSNAFLLQNNLPAPSSVKSALAVLMEKDLVYHDANGYMVYDRFFGLWLKQLV